MYLCPESPQYQAFRAFSVFRGLGGLVRHRPASYRGDHIVPWRLIFAHPCPARICQKRGNAKKYPLPDSATSFNENNLAGTLRLPLLSHSRSNGSPQSPQITLISRVARIMVPQQGQTYLMLRLMDFLLPPLVVPSTGKRLALILSSPKVFLIHASASGASVVAVQPYLACFSICRPWASAVALNFWLW